MTVSDTLADGVHMTGGASGGTVSDVTTSGTGDDGVAVVSYSDDGLCSDITERNITVNGNRWGRGITVVGGTRITISGFAVSNTSAAGLYIASEGNPYFTQSTSQVSASNGTITSANIGSVVQGAVLVYAGRGVSGVQVSDVTIGSTPAKAGRDVAVLADGGGAVDGISFSRITLVSNSVQPFVTNAPRSATTTSGWTVNGTATEVR